MFTKKILIERFNLKVDKCLKSMPKSKYIAYNNGFNKTTLSCMACTNIVLK
jgi:hypothetical protein